MKKAIIITPFKPGLCFGGVERFNLYIEEYLKSRGFEVCYITKEEAGFRTTMVFRKIEEEIFSWKVGEYASNLACDVVISNGYYGWGYKGKAKRINIYHGTMCGFASAQKEWPYLRRIKAHFLRGILAEGRSGRNSECVAVSKKVAEEVERYYGLKCETIENAVDTSLFRPEESVSAIEKNGKLRGLFVGTMNTGKGFGIVKEIIQRNKDIEWTLVLGGQEKNETNIGVDVKVITRVKYNEMPQHYRNADFLVLPSTYEGLSYAVLEALSCGIIPITTETGGCREMASFDFLKPFIVRIGSEEELVRNIDKALKTLKTIGEERGRITKMARQLAVSRYSLEKWYEEWDKKLVRWGICNSV